MKIHRSIRFLGVLTACIFGFLTLAAQNKQQPLSQDKSVESLRPQVPPARTLTEIDKANMAKSMGDMNKEAVAVPRKKSDPGQAPIYVIPGSGDRIAGLDEKREKKATSVEADQAKSNSNSASEGGFFDRLREKKPSNLPWGSAENKDAWIKAHPTEYGAMNQPAGVTKLTKKELAELPQAKRDHVLNHPEQFQIIENNDNQ
jgi:hypothetical protein